MCGIIFISKYNESSNNLNVLKHRGPDETKIIEFKDRLCVFNRLAINDLSEYGSQPFVSKDSIFMCNGEIYNFKYLISEYYDDNKMTSTSDCEILYHMFNNQKTDPIVICKLIDGDFAFVYKNHNTEIVGRDPMGVRPLFFGVNKFLKFEFSSEAKGITKTCNNVTQFPPGFIWDSKNGFRKYTSLTLPTYFDLKPSFANANNLHNLLVNSVKKRLLSDVDIGFLLSGGLDSSIIASIGSKLMYPKRIKTFSVGVKGFSSPDLEYAKEMAVFLNSEHTVYEFDIKEAVELIPTVIWHLESYDTTTVRASVPMFMLCRHISQKFSDIKVLLSGEGADELFGGYLYFHNAPDKISFHNETIRLLKDIHKYDGLRADRCTAANGLELRVPFLDKALIEYITADIDPTLKIPLFQTDLQIEKKILRDSFKQYLPDSIYNRQKNGMSDAVGYSWVDYLKENITSDYYLNLYKKDYNKVDNIKYQWMPKWTDIKDPSARLLSNFNCTYKTIS